MMGQSHADGCLELAAASRAEHDAWVARWPHSCRACRGWGIGGKHWTSEDDYDVDPCGDCSESGTCPRCGGPGLTSEERGDDSTGEGPCRLCGWDYDDGEPEVIGCTCGAGDPPEEAVAGKREVIEL
jgi:hypothetical protein